MTIAIDFDGTFNADPDLFREFALHALQRGHKVVLVTGRSDDGQWGEEVRKVVNDCIPIVFAGMNGKNNAATLLGWEVDVWIDDHPQYIFTTTT